MLEHKRIFSGYSVDNIDKAKAFYTDVLGIDAKKNEMGALELAIGNEASVFIYPKPNHTPATYTVLNIVVNDVEKAVDELSSKGVNFEHYGPDMKQDEKGISRGMGPVIAWFKDPAGNIISVIEDRG